MKTVYVQKQIKGWEEFSYEVPDDFTDYQSLIDDENYSDWEYLYDAAEYTGRVDFYDENFNVIKL